MKKNLIITITLFKGLKTWTGTKTLYFINYEYSYLSFRRTNEYRIQVLAIEPYFIRIMALLGMEIGLIK